jgi:dTDP-glucose 4,6-dehydratase
VNRVLVTGGAGFVGSHLVDRLVAQGREVVVVDNLSSGSQANLADALASGRARLMVADICDGIPHVEEKIDWVMHLASPASPEDYSNRPLDTLRVGSVGTWNTLVFARQHSARYLLASTSEVYGDPEQHPQGEEYWGNVNPIGPRSCYDEAKRFAEALTVNYAAVQGLDVRIVRIFNTYGPRMRSADGRVVSTFLEQLLAGRAVTVYGDGQQTRSFQYIDDLIEGILAVMQGVHRGPFNLGSPDETTILRLAEELAEVVGADLRVEHIDGARPEDPRRRRPDISRARALLGWQPRISLREGLRRTVASMRPGASLTPNEMQPVRPA